MADTNQNVTIEGFVTDLAFDDRTKNVNGVFAPNTGQVAALTAKVLSYFQTPTAFQDRRDPANRVVNWNATTAPRLIVDQVAFGTFVNTINAQTSDISKSFFKIIDKLFFNYQTNDTKADLETFLTTDASVKNIYVPKSFAVSATRVTDTVYLDNNATLSVDVPSFIDFKVVLPTGATTTTFTLRLYTSVDAWLTGYNISSIAKVIPPLGYQQLYESSLTDSVDSIFSTASLTANLSFVNTEMLLGNISLSGTIEYKAIITDGVNKISVPFNILYKGRRPTLFEIRNAIKQALVDSGVGTEERWRERIPGVYVTGRFYVVPLWDQTYQKPDQLLFPNISPYPKYNEATAKILASLGYGDITARMDVFSIFYNRMTATAVPDLSGTIAVQHLSEIIPDYQDYSPSDEQFAYMLDTTQTFAKELNTVISVDSGVTNSQVYTSTTEGQLTFYSFTVDSYEVCVITKLCYATIMESIQ